jgi:hypothetical protein
MRILTILFLFFSLNSFAQQLDDEWVKFNNLPDTVSVQVDSIHFKNALHLIEGGYLVETGVKGDSIFRKDNSLKRIRPNKNIRIDTMYSESGEIIDVHRYKSGLSKPGCVALVAMITYFTFLLSGAN